MKRLKNHTHLTVRQKTTYNAVRLKDIVLILAMVAGGMILAVFILIIERAYYIFSSLLTSDEKRSIVRKSSKLHGRFRKKEKRSERNARLEETHDASYWRPIEYRP